MKRIFGLLMLTAFFASAAVADVRLPDTPSPTPAKTVKPAKTLDATMQIEFSEKEKTARLVIPKSQLNQLRAELDALDGGGSTTFSGISRAQTVAGGLFLSLAAVFGGVWFVRFGKTASKKSKIAAAGAVLFFSGVFASAAFANIAPFRNAEITSRIFNDDYFSSPLGLSGGVKLEIAQSGDRILLIVPKVKDEDR
jgi:hypothetical protein